MHVVAIPTVMCMIESDLCSLLPVVPLPPSTFSMLNLKLECIIEIGDVGTVRSDERTMQLRTSNPQSFIAIPMPRKPFCSGHAVEILNRNKKDHKKTRHVLFCDFVRIPTTSIALTLNATQVFLFAIEPIVLFALESQCRFCPHRTLCYLQPNNK